MDGLTELLVARTGSDLRQLRADFHEESEQWRQERRSGEAGEGTPTSRYLMALLRAARRNHFGVPPRVLSLYRTLLTAETVTHELGATTDLAAAGRPLFTRLQAGNVLNLFRPEAVQATVLDALSN